MKFKFTPDQAFQKKAKQRFLAVFDAHYPASLRPATPGAWLLFITKAAVAVLALAAVGLGGIAVYADTANVPADSPLYKLKRIQEEVRLTVAPPAEKAVLQASFAKRRAEEIKDLSARTPSSTMIQALSTDEDAAVNASVQAAVRAHVADGALAKMCAALSKAVEDASASPSFGNVAEICSGADGVNQQGGSSSIERPHRPGGGEATTTNEATATEGEAATTTATTTIREDGGDYRPRTTTTAPQAPDREGNPILRGIQNLLDGGAPVKGGRD